MIKLQLHENWQLCNIRQLDWIPAQIPGDIYAALLKTGKMPDPFFGDNEYQAKALMEEDYEYRTVFNYEEAQFKDCQEVILRFDGIDTIADIYLNGCCLGKVDNMHRIWEFPVGELLENGKNTLRVIIRSPLKFMAEAFKKYKNRGNEDTIEGFMHLRKAHYMCGWDWGACLPDGGIFRPVTLLGIETARLNGKQIGQFPGRTYETKKSKAAKRIIMKHNQDFGGSLNDIETMKQAGISKKTFYKYKNELQMELS